jgi:hypothetical protein
MTYGVKLAARVQGADISVQRFRSQGGRTGVRGLDVTENKRHVLIAKVGNTWQTNQKRPIVRKTL